MKQFLTIIALVIAVFISGCNSGGADSDKPKVAFVTNGIASFWVVAEAGVKDAGEKFDVNAIVKMPAEGVVDQKRILEDLLTQGVDGIAISPIDPEGQQDLLNEVGETTNYITHDSDAPETNRLCYIGMDNYDAGRMAGKLVKEAIPDGGEVMIFVGRLEQLNAKLRRQGVIDELLDREPDSSRYDEPGKSVEGEKYTILDTRTDGFDFAKAKAQAQDSILKYPNLKCMVGLFAYNPPLMLDALKEAEKTDEIEIVAFDEEDGTLQGIVDGYIHGTVVQNPYEYGYKSIEVLTALAKGDDSIIPEDKFINIPARQIRKDNVIEFWTDLNTKLNKEPPQAAAKDTQDTAEKEAE